MPRASLVGTAACVPVADVCMLLFWFLMAVAMFGAMRRILVASTSRQPSVVFPVQPLLFGGLHWLGCWLSFSSSSGVEARAKPLFSFCRFL